MNRAQISQLQDRYVIRWYKRWRVVLREMLKPVLESIEVSGVAATLDNMDHMMQSDHVRAEMRRFYFSAGMPFARGLLREYKLHKDSFDLYFEAAMDSFVTENLGQRIVSITGTSKDEVIDILRGLIDSGDAVSLSRAEIQNKVIKAYGSFERMSAARIARTEIATITNKARSIAVESIGHKVQKQWTAGGKNIRPEHQAASNGEWIDKELPYNVGGENLMYPGDPAGSAWNVINCKCVEVYRIL